MPHDHQALPYQEFARAHYYYRNIGTKNFLLSQDAVMQSTNPQELSSKLQAALYISPLQIEHALANFQSGLPAPAHQSLIAMIEAMVRFAAKEKNDFSSAALFTEAEERKFEELKAKCLHDACKTGEYFYNFALLCIKFNRMTEAVQLFEESVLLKPDLFQAHAMIAFINTFCQQWEKGLRHAEISLGHGYDMGPNMINLCLTTCALKLGKENKGFTSVRAIEKEYPFTLEDAKAYFPPVNEADFDHSHHTKDILYIPSDPNYFLKHSLALVCSIAKHCPDKAVHLHIMNPTPGFMKEIIEPVKNVFSCIARVSSETGDVNEYSGAPAYYSTVRDFRLYQLVSRNTQRVTRLDADMLIMKPIDNIFGVDQASICLAHSEEFLSPFWEFVDGAIWSFKQSPESVEMLKSYAMLMYDNFKHKTYTWFGGQLLMAYLYDRYKDTFSISVIDSNACFDLKHGDDSVIWSITTDKLNSKRYLATKHALLTEYGFARFIAVDEVQALA